MDELEARFEQDRLEQELGEAALARAVVEARAVASSQRMVPILTFFNRDETAILVAMIYDDRVVLYRFGRNGPWGDYTLKDESRLYSEVLAQGFLPVADPVAGKVLDSWTSGKAWAQGMKEVLFLAYWQWFHDHQRGDLCRELQGHGSTSAAIMWAAEQFKKHWPDENVYEGGVRL